MKNAIIEPIALSDQDIKALSKLLLNSWSAEYALRITAVENDEEYVRKMVMWTLPQAYYSVFFSIRGVLLTVGHSTSQTLSILAAVDVFHKCGLYEDTDLPGNFLSELHALKFNTYENLQAQEINPLTEQSRLLSIVEQAAFAHEAHILDVLGEDVYTNLIESVPVYIRGGFLSERFKKLIAGVKAAEWLTDQLSMPMP